MGRRNAERMLKRSLEGSKPKLVVTAGFAGGLRPGLSRGTVLFETEEAVLARALCEAGGQPGTFHCGERVATTADEKRLLFETTGADAVEMESGIICALCRRQGIPCATVRVVLDTAEEDLPLDFNKLMTTEQNLDAIKVALALARSPRMIPALLRLRRDSKAAAKTLATVLGRVCGI